MGKLHQKHKKERWVIRPHYCSYCQGVLQWMRLDHKPRLVCQQCGRVHYLDPRLAVAILLYEPKHVVYLAKRLVEPGWGQWIMPGGYVEPGEDLRGACLRELKEELHLSAGPLRLMGIYLDRPNTFTAVFSSPLIRGVKSSGSPELSALHPFAWPDIPWNHLYFQSTHLAIRDFMAESLWQEQHENAKPPAL